MTQYGFASFASAHPFIQLVVVEDQLINQKVLCAMLHRLGYPASMIQLAVNGAKGVEVVEEQCKTGKGGRILVFMDVYMPVMDGLEATRTIRAKRAEESTAESRALVWIVALTANAMSGDQAVCLAAGMDDYLTKPVTTVRLQAVIKKAHAATNST